KTSLSLRRVRYNQTADPAYLLTTPPKHPALQQESAHYKELSELVNTLGKINFCPSRRESAAFY
ncbi:MAG: hypothetical protein PHW25_21280, partial [Zoogloea sp.]|uniref:hypothetical protein n=1 Tax=Zoogloea sp. TaxID=49181 RepID=UPI00260D4046